MFLVYLVVFNEGLVQFIPFFYDATASIVVQAGRVREGPEGGTGGREGGSTGGSTGGREYGRDRKSTRLNSSPGLETRMPSSA